MENYTESEQAYINAKVEKFDQLDEYKIAQEEYRRENATEINWGEAVRTAESTEKFEAKGSGEKLGTKRLKEFNERIIDFAKKENYFYPNYAKTYEPFPESLEHFSWVNTFIGEYPSKTPKMHYQIVDLLADEDTEEITIQIHREGAKTTLVTEQQCIRALQSGYFIGFGEVTNIIIFAATRSMVVDIFKSIKATRDNSEELYSTMPLARTKDNKVIADRENEICIQAANGKNIYLQARSVGESMRGTRREGVRPQVVVNDDYLKDEEIYSEEARRKTLVWKYGVVMPACNSSVMRITEAGTEVRRKIINVGTPMAENDALTLSLHSKYSTGLFLPLVQNFGTKYAKSNWEDLHPLHEIKKMYETAKETRTLPEFYRERQLKTKDDSLGIMKKKDFKYWDKQRMKQIYPRTIRYTTLDMAVAGNKKSGRVVLMTIAVDTGGRWYVMRTDSGDFTPREVIKKLFDHMNIFGSTMFKAESAALQQVLDFFIVEEQERTGVYFPMETLTNNSSVSKEARVYGLEPRLSSGRIYLNPDEHTENQELIEQMTGLTKDGFTTKLRDNADCFANFNDPDFIEQVFADDSLESYFREQNQSKILSYS